MKSDFWKKSNLRVILHLLTSWLPVSRRTFNQYKLDSLEVLTAQRELQMMTRQDIILLANRMIKFHGQELKKEKGAPVASPATPIVEVKDNTENMYG